MKSMMSWFCLAAITNVTVAFANDGLDAYRLGDYNKAANLLTNAESQDPITNYYIARMRLYGYGQMKNNTLAIRHFKLAADKGLLSAQQIMARYELIEKNNPEQALYWFKKAADSHDISAQMYCAAAYLFGVGVKKNPDTAKRYYIAAAKNGNSIAQYTVAESFFETHQSANKKLGLRWLDKAIEQHNPEAQVILSEQYASGVLLERNLDKAKEMAQLAVAQNYVPALYQMGRLERSQKHVEEAEKWYIKAASTNYIPAVIALAELYSETPSPLHNAHEGFLWMLKAAELGSAQAQTALANVYKKGIGVDADEHLAIEWQQKAVITAKSTPEKASIQAAEWLTDRKSTQFAGTVYGLQGILGAWHDPRAKQQNNYNQPPQMETITRIDLYQPQFVMIKPTDIPINEYYDMLVATMSDIQQDKWIFPRYALHAQGVESPKGSIGEDSLQQLASTPEQSDHYKKLFKRLESQAILGDTTAQFDVGQMHQHGLGVEKNAQEAIKYYQLAAAQQDLPSEYNLGLLYLLGSDITADYKLAIEWLDDAAFKGNAYAQYVLARIYDHGYRNAENQEVIAADPEQSMAMYKLAAANNFGLAQYRLAELLVRQKQTDISLTDKEKRNQLIKKLYQGAAADGVEQAHLPLAFYDAMDSDITKQQLAFSAANTEAIAGNKQAALLLGLMYDRGIGVEANQDSAIHWYQQAAENPVSAFILGTYTFEGIGVSKDPAKARELLQRAVDSQFSYANMNLGILKQRQGDDFLPDLQRALAQGNSRAGLLMADYYVSRFDQEQKMKQARDIYQQFAERGDKQAQLKLGFLYEQGIGGPVELSNAERWYTEAANQAQPQAQYLLASLYQLGKLTKLPDYAQAKKWYAAAQTHYPPAAVALGFIYDTEDDNYQHAMADYQRAVDQGDVVGAFNLGLLYERGESCPVNTEKAEQLYLQAAQKGHNQAMVQLAGLYLNGQGGWDVLNEALNWYKKASALGNRDAMYQLGLMSETGVATKLDYSEATRYYQMAFDRGDVKAGLALARMYQYGLGVSKDLHEANKIYSSLSERGNPYAQYQMALFCFKGITKGCQPEQGVQLLKKAQENGSLAATKTLRLVNAQSKPQVSFIESIQLKTQPMIVSSSADIMYLDALNAWNLGNEAESKAILAHLLEQYPNNALAKQAYKQLLSIDSSLNPRADVKNTAYLDPAKQ
ncbi:MAG: tetratricopeptide repeat protein [Legionellaceae bacterium]|nr:tetratricopeptide repeat protein [Legionellaceae bacterium]